MEMRDCNGWTALSLACAQPVGRSHFVTRLLAYGANPHFVNQRTVAISDSKYIKLFVLATGYSLLHITSSSSAKNSVTLKVLLDIGVDTKIESNLNKETALHFAAQCDKLIRGSCQTVFMIQ